MKGQELLDNYPKAGELITNWYVKRFLDSMNDEGLPEDFKKFAMEAGLPKEKIGPLIDTGPRALFDFFDENEVYIETNVNSVGEVFFSYSVNGVSGKNAYPKRKDAETAAIEESFKLLEEKCQTSS